MLSLFQIPQAVGSQDPGALEEIRSGYGHGQGLGDSRHSGTVRGGLSPRGCGRRPGLGAAPHCVSLPAVQELRQPLLCGGLHPGEPSIPASDRPRHRTHRFPFVGAVWNIFREQMNQAINRPLSDKTGQRLFCAQQHEPRPRLFRPVCKTKPMAWSERNPRVRSTRLFLRKSSGFLWPVRACEAVFSPGWGNDPFQARKSQIRPHKGKVEKIPG